MLSLCYIHSNVQQNDENCLTLSIVKTMVLILSFLMSLLSGDRDVSTSSISTQNLSCVITTQPSDTKSLESALNRDVCITTARGYSFAGREDSSSATVRSMTQGRRTTPQTRSNSRIIKGGKVIENNNLHPFLAQSFVLLSGFHISERYLYSLCLLRI